MNSFDKNRSCTVAQARERDSTAINNLGIPSIVLMENAGIQVVNVLLGITSKQKTVRLHSKQKALILCGKGNNAGDGLVVARHLYNKGFQVDVWLCSGMVATKDAKVNYQIIKNMDIPYSVFDEGVSISDNDLDLLFQYDVIIDALYGTGFHGAISDKNVILISERLSSRSQREIDNPLIVSIDIPSGLNGDTGQPVSFCLKANLTIALDCLKIGLTKEIASEYVGEVVVVDIGIF